MNMKKTFHLLTLIILLNSCVENKSEIKMVEFKSKYKFNSEIEEKIKTDTVFGKYQFAAWEYAFKGDYKNALIQWDFAFEPTERNFTKNEIDSIRTKYKKVNAKEYIIGQSKLNKIIIINEAHHNSLHRAFTKSLLQDLFNNGYKNLGLEDLTNGEKKDSMLYDRKYPTKETGFYIKDPQFGDLVRTAINIGYKVFPYEQTTGSNGKLREIEQARNIKKVIEKNPDEKFLIHCGFGHVLEGIHNSLGKTMAGRITEYTKINPLTINQVVYSEKSKPEYNHPLLKAFNLEEPTILLDKENNPYKNEQRQSWTDISLFHPNTQYINERPNWLFKNNNKGVKINLNNIDILFPVMILAYKKGENINTAIPMDIIEIENKNKLAFLSLKKGDYEIVVVNQIENARKFNLNVK